MESLPGGYGKGVWRVWESYVEGMGSLYIVCEKAVWRVYGDIWRLW